MAQKSREKSKKSATSRAKIKNLSVRKPNADKVKGGMTPGPEDLK